MIEFEFLSKLKIKSLNITNKYFLKKLNFVREKIRYFCSGYKKALPNAELIRSKHQINRLNKERNIFIIEVY